MIVGFRTRIFAAQTVFSTLALLGGWCGAWNAHAQQVAVPPLTAHVSDQTHTLTAEQTATLEDKLTAFEARKGSQIAVLIVPSTGQEGIEQYALRVAEQWKLGRKKVDDGVLFLIAKNDRTLRIEVGYGLEGALNDAMSQRIISQMVVPRLKENDFYGAVAAGVDAIMRVAEGESLPEPAQGTTQSAERKQSFLPALLVIALVGAQILRLILGRVFGALATAGLVGVMAWWAMSALSIALIAGALAFCFALFSGLRGGLGFPSMGGGSGWGHRSGGGGFSGGGGSFGGGGASGRW